MKCDYCEIVEQKRNAEILYEDDALLIAIKDTVVTPGQISVIPKQHFTIVEMMPATLLERCAVLANKISMAVFDALGASGTNILIQNGLAGGQKVPHVALEIIPRQENDTLPLQWQPKQLSEVDLETSFAALQEELKHEQKQAEKLSSAAEHSPTVGEQATEQKQEEKQKKDSYLLKSINRLP